MKYYSMSVSDTFKTLESDRRGLTSAEAEKRLARNGLNRLEEGKKTPLFSKFIRQLADPMIIILLAAAAVSGFMSVYAREGFADVIIILAVVIINAVLGLYQENKAERAIEALREMSAARAKALRDGGIRLIRSEELVTGDVILLEAGDAIPADGRIFESSSLQIEEAALTGESVPVYKLIDIINLSSDTDVPLGDRSNMVYTGSTVSYGRGKAVVTETGMDTEMGKIASAIAGAADEKTPLQIKLSQLSKILTVLVVAVCAVIFAVGLFEAKSFSGKALIDMFMVAVSLAVAAIPEGLAAVVTIVLSIGVTNMSRKNAIIRRLTAVETLGCAQIICSDKTGTLTQNKMTVVESCGKNDALLAAAMALCSDAEPDDKGIIAGEPTECALVGFALSMGIDKKSLKQKYPRVGEAPFDSGRKMMSTIHKTGGEYIQYTKGAPDEVLKRCSSYLENGVIRPMTEQKRAEISAQVEAMAARALRVLMAATRKYSDKPSDFSPQKLECELCFIGLAGMIDPVRPEVKAAIAECRLAGIRPIMITGDHIETAKAIALELGILSGDNSAVTGAEPIRGAAITGAELSIMSDDVFELIFRDVSVYARVQPEHKVRIVKAWRRAGYVTAMTGDGVNDAPSIKTADIGVGMGITGTDVTKNVADMVLSDDNFATIVGAVSEGRRIYDNIRKAIQFLLSSNMSEVLSIFTATLMGFVILRPVHLLWINLITDCFPALALGMEKAEPDIMRKPPRDVGAGIFANGMGFDVVYQGIMVTALTLLAYFIGSLMETGSWAITTSAEGMTMAFITISMTEIFHSFNMRSQRGSVFALKKTNRALILAAAASLLLTTAVIYVPFFAAAFGFAQLGGAEYIAALILSISCIPIVELVKAIRRKVPLSVNA